MFVSVTRLRVRSARYLPAFAWNTLLSERQAVRALGFIGGRLLIDVGRTFWTMTAWETDKGMKAFRGSKPHAQAMPRLATWCDEAAYAHWTKEDAAIPSWPEAYARLVREGRLSRVANPSRHHEARQFAEPRLSPLIGRDMKPATRKK